ncbi:MAG TPA: mechanosensitive ion channel family protein [Gemmatimonadaceae bacterium]|nr:mechanosensitive ion channel family protein [Gemmatimonadaceae bacterium]
MELSTLLNREFLGNTLLSWLIAAAVFVAVFAALKILRRILLGRFTRLAERTTTGIDDLVADLFRHTHGWFVLLVALGAASAPLTIPPNMQRYIRMLLGAGVIVQLMIWGNTAINGWMKRQSALREGALGTLTAIAFMARLALWAVLLILLLDNFGLKVTTLLGALGVVGIAGALAAQSVLGDLFAAISIFLDKPFEVGDFIVFDGLSGSVRGVGLRSTRINAIGGEQIIVSNSDLLKSRISNYKRMAERRVAFQIGVVYGLPRDVVAEIPALIRSAVEDQEQVRFDRSHFKGYGASSLDFETVYYVLSPDYTLYMDIQQAINLGILRRFEEKNIGFAFPTRTVIVEQTAVADRSSGATKDGIGDAQRERAAPIQ